MRMLVALAVASCSFAIASAQIRIDAGTSVGFTSASASFRDLPGFPTCCPSFESGSGTGLGLGLGVDIPIAGSLFASVRFAANDRSHTMSTNELVDIIVGNRLVQSTIEHTFALPLTEYGLESHIGYRFGGLTIRTGIGYSHRALGSVRAKEEIVDPSGVRFTETQSTTRNARTALMPGSITSAWHWIGVLGFDISLKRGSAWKLTPEASLTTALTSVTSVTPWILTTTSIGLRLSYTFGVNNQPVLAPSKEPRKLAATPPAAAKPIVPSTLQPVNYDVKLESDSKLNVRIEEIEEERYLPVLPYMFFDRNSARVPARYAQRPLRSISTADISDIELHRQVLNVIAERMKLYPAAKLTLTGSCAADEQDTSLAIKRAMSIASVLVDSFGVDKRRIVTRSRRAPLDETVATGGEALAAYDENRRVEFSSVESQLLMPYRVADTTLTMDPPSIMIRAKTLDGKPLDSWIVSVDGADVDSSSRQGKVEFAYQPTQAAAQSALANAGMSITIEGRQSGAPVRDTLQVRVNAVRLFDKRKEMRNDSIIERYTLIVFPFRKADLTDAHQQILNFVRSRIGVNARIIVEGSTDILGSTDENARLSRERAATVARELQGSITIKGLGEPEAGVSQRLPEERMLRRIVTITAYVPVGGK